MHDSDRNEFVCALDELYSFYEAHVSSYDHWWRALKDYSLDAIKAAFEEHITDPQQGIYPPKPAHILGRLKRMVQAEDGRPGPEEAWSIALRAMDEAATVVWSQEIATAYGAAKLILEAGDEVGARMAFKEVYGKEVARARSLGQEVKWMPSLGYDGSQRAPALVDAAQRLNLDYLTETARLELEWHQGPIENVREHIAEIKRILTVTVGQTERRDHIQVIIEGLPEDRKARKAAIDRLDGPTRRKVKHVLGEIERVRQLEVAKPLIEQERLEAQEPELAAGAA